MRVVKVINERVPEGQPPVTVCRVWCPGCDLSHRMQIDAASGPVWEWNGSEEAPSFSPSILVWWIKGEERAEYRCHSFIRDGRWEFLTDCTHALAGQTVDMVPLPDWYKTADEQAP